MKSRITLLVAMATLLAGIASAETFNNSNSASHAALIPELWLRLSCAESGNS
jgi:hypothetical protein